MDTDNPYKALEPEAESLASSDSSQLNSKGRRAYLAFCVFVIPLGYLAFLGRSFSIYHSSPLAVTIGYIYVVFGAYAFIELMRAARVKALKILLFILGIPHFAFVAYSLFVALSSLPGLIKA